MIELSLGEVAEIVHGRLAGGADPGTLVTGGVEFDSRRVGPGGLFLAVAGDQVDGHDFAAAAIAAGAVAVIATRPVDGPSIEVGDPLTALADLAREVLRRLPDLLVIGITGSSGKTSTKDLLAQVLAEAGATVAAPGSFNNELGHPYTVLRADRSTRFLITEVSARGIGHIRYLTQIAPPRIGVVLNVGSAHLGEFGSQAAIAVAKGELVEALPPAVRGGVAVLNGDDPLVRAMAARTEARVVLVGRAADCDVRAADVHVDEAGRASFRLESAAGTAQVALAVRGEHQVGNALAVAAVAIECGLDLPTIAAALARAQALSPWRMQVNERADGVTVINDAYNANPESMRAALDALHAMAQTPVAGSARRTWAVLGPMAELGPGAAGAHLALGRSVAELGIGRLVTVGEAARPIADGTVLEGWDADRADRVPDIATALQLLERELAPGDVVLVKASRSAGLERIGLALADGNDGADRTDRTDREVRA